jgi:hypothetical protein
MPKRIAESTTKSEEPNKDHGKLHSLVHSHTTQEEEAISNHVEGDERVGVEGRHSIQNFDHPEVKTVDVFFCEVQKLYSQGNQVNGQNPFRIGDLQIAGAKVTNERDEHGRYEDELLKGMYDKEDDDTANSDRNRDNQICQLIDSHRQED